MMRKYLLTVMLIFAITAGAWAQEDENTESKEVLRMSDHATSLQLAGDLAKYGYANNSASSLIEAAKIIRESGFNLNNSVKAEHSSVEHTVQPKNNPFTLDVDKLLSDAKRLAAGDKTLLAMADAVKKADTRGYRIDYVYDRVYSHSTDSWTIDFNTTGWHYVYVDGDGDTDLDVYVYDCYGNFKGKDIKAGDRCYVSFYVDNPYCDYTVKVKNLGSVYNDYYFSYGKE